MLKTVVVGALALLLGVFFGSLGPRAEARKLRKELEVARAEADEAQARPIPMLPMLPGFAGDRDPLPPPRFAEPARASDSPAADARDAGTRDGRFFSSDAFAVAKTAADARAAQFRAAFVEDARLTADEQAALTRVVDDLNRDVAKAAEELAKELREKNRRLATREMADVASRLLDVYRRSDDRLQATLDEEARAAATRTGFDVLTQIDLAAMKSLGEVVEQLGFTPPGGRRRPESP